MILCPSLIYGIGHGVSLDSMQVPWLINVAKKYGGAKHSGSGGNRWSNVHIDDLVIAIVFLMENNESHGKIFGITDGKTYSSDQILNTLINIHNAKNPLWKVSKPILMFLSGDSGIRKKFQKILEDDLVDDEEISNLGFKAQFSLENLYEKIF